MILKFTSIITFFVLISHNFSIAQVKHDYKWVIGRDTTLAHGGTAIAIDFTQSDRNIFSINTVEGFQMAGSNTSISNKDGDLLFYSNGCYIVNAAHEIMENGDSINPGLIQDIYCPVGGSPYTQGIISIPAPESDSLYYVFNLDMQTPFLMIDSLIGIAPEHLFYHIIDISQNNGLGKVIYKNKIAVKDTLAKGNIQAVKHANGEDWWIIVPKVLSNCYFIIPATKDGIGNPILQCIGRRWNDDDTVGQVIFSPDGKKYIRFNPWNGLNIFDFNTKTGKLSNPLIIDFPDHYFTVAGAAVSPNSHYIYASAHTKVFQFDLKAEDIAASRVTIAEWDGYRNPSPTIFYLAALAPDGKIYISSTSSTYNLHVIHNPDCPGLESNLEQHGVVSSSPKLQPF